jgi:hypothetical protein
VSAALVARRPAPPCQSGLGPFGASIIESLRITRRIMTARAGVFPGTGSTTLLHACRRRAMSFRKGTSSDQADLDRLDLSRSRGRVTESQTATVSKKASALLRGTEGSNPCTLQSGYWLVDIVDWSSRAGRPGVARESPCSEHLERSSAPAGRPRRKSRGRLRFERQYRD